MADCKNKYKSVGERLHSSDSNEFNLDRFYIFGWSGALSHKERKKASKELYSYLAGHKGSITLICHSHGCNVALALVGVAQKMRDSSLSIDRLILLAPPVQHITAPHVVSSLFKKVISFYSTADVMQVLDLQKLSKAKKKDGAIQPMRFSERKFAAAPNLKQVRILVNMQNPGHRSFLQKPFLLQLPTILNLIETEQPTCSDYIVNVPPDNEKAYLLQQIRLAYTPRHHRSKAARLFA